MLDKPLEYPPSVVESQEYPFDWYWEISVCEFPVYGISQRPSTFSEHALSPVSSSTHRENRCLRCLSITYLEATTYFQKLHLPCLRLHFSIMASRSSASRLNFFSLSRCSLAFLSSSIFFRKESVCHL